MFPLSLLIHMLLHRIHSHSVVTVMADCPHSHPLPRCVAVADGWVGLIDGYVDDGDYQDSPAKPDTTAAQATQELDTTTLCLQRCQAASIAGSLSVNEVALVRKVLRGAIGGPQAVTAVIEAEKHSLPALKSVLAVRCLCCMLWG